MGEHGIFMNPQILASTPFVKYEFAGFLFSNFFELKLQSYPCIFGHWDGSEPLAALVCKLGEICTVR
jgi:hypothetical protein